MSAPAQPEVQEEPPVPELTVRYMGRRILSDRKLGHGYRLEPLDDRRPIFFTTPLAKYSVVGDRLVVQDKGGGIYRFVRTDRAADDLDRDLLTAWVADDRANATAQMADQDERARHRKGREAIDGLTLAELREELHRMPAPRRQAFLATILGRLGA